MIRRDFDSIAEMIQAPFTRTDNYERCAQQLGHPGAWGPAVGLAGHGTSWYGGTAAQAAERAERGWVEGADEALKRLANLSVPLPTSVKRKLVREDHGDELDIHAVYRGDLSHAWSSRKRRPVRGSMLVRLVSQSDVNAWVTAEQLFWRGAALIKMADILTAAGYSVEILGVTSSTSAQGYPGDRACW